jgi:hypothetical protein
MGRTKKNPPKKAEESEELRNHVFGPGEGLAIAKSFAASLRVISDPCGACKRKPTPEIPFEWALVSAVTPKNRLSRKAAFIVQLKDLAGGRSVSVNVGDEEGGDKVSNNFCHFW